jgi:hypothetical protein
MGALSQVEDWMSIYRRMLGLGTNTERRIPAPS